MMLTFGDPGKPIAALGQQHTKALRITMGRLSRRGRWHGWQPCVFWIVDGKRVGP
jgi:hypothetical protein